MTMLDGRVRSARFPLDLVRKRAFDALVEAGAKPRHAGVVSRVLTDAEARGHPSHGIALLPLYLKRIVAGGIDVEAEPVWDSERGPVASLDANGGFGQVAADLAASRCAERAASRGMFAVAVHGNNHIGMLAAYREPFASRGVTGLVFNVSGPSIAPPSGTRPVLGNNALCLIAPRANGDPFIVDFATGTVACGKIRQAGYRGDAVPEHWLLDRRGRPSADPADLDDGGSVPVFGGYKGLGVHLIVEVLAGVIAGNTVSPRVNRQRPQPDRPMGSSQLFVGFSEDVAGPRDTDALLDELASAVASSYSEARTPAVYLPEQQEAAHARLAERSGIEIPLPLADELGWNDER